MPRTILKCDNRVTTQFEKTSKSKRHRRVNYQNKTRNESKAMKLCNGLISLDIEDGITEK